jgi:hypothetical protein
MRRQLVASGAAVITALAVGLAMVAAPAYADHEEPLSLTADDGFPGGNVECEDLDLIFLDKIEFEGDQPTVIDNIEDLVDPADYDLDIVAVIVKGGTASNIYEMPPFHDLVAPDGKEISHVEICGGELPTEPPTDEPTEPPTDEPTEPPTEEPTEPAESPAPVPTEVPAGTNTGGSDSLGLWGLIAGSCAAVAGAAVVVRRRFLHDS